MIRVYLFAGLTALLFPVVSQAQFALTKGDHTFEIGGDIMAGYNYDFYPAGTTDFHKNTFLLDEARFHFTGDVGTYSGCLEYKVEIDLADLAADIQQPTTPPTYLGFLKDAYAQYATPIVTVKAGYQKVPYGFNGIVEEINDPFLNRPLIATKINSRRDLGVTLSHWFPRLRLTALGGVYSGMGEEVFSTDNTGGHPEYIGRLEYSFPGRSIKYIVDMHDAQVPMFQCGANIRYMDGTVTSPSDYNLINVNGQKTSYGFDASLMYKGISLQVEAHQMMITPHDSTLFSEGKTYKYFKAGGYLVELNYYCRPVKSVFAVRYDYLNPDDLVYGFNPTTLAFAYNYFIKQNFLAIKIQYEHHLPYSYPSGTIWKDDALTAEFQVIFN